MFRILLLFLRRLWLPLAVFAGFSVLCVLVDQWLEGLSWQDALFWMIHPHAIETRRVHNATKLFAIFVYAGVFGFQIWVAERVAVTIFKRQGVEAWRTMVNDVSAINCAITSSSAGTGKWAARWWINSAG
ncbi:MAG: hypothetical protein WB660_08890 [Candidatus Sulfotelmatobacter sp.]